MVADVTVHYLDKYFLFDGFQDWTPNRCRKRSGHFERRTRPTPLQPPFSSIIVITATIQVVTKLGRRRRV